MLGVGRREYSEVSQMLGTVICLDWYLVVHAIEEQSISGFSERRLAHSSLPLLMTELGDEAEVPP